MSKPIAFLASAAIAIALAGPASGQGSATQSSAGQSWLNSDLSPEARARAAVEAMTLDEKLRLIFGYSDQAVTEISKVPDDIVSQELKAYVQTRAVKGSAGFVPGVPRLGIPDQWQTDASMGVRNSLIPSTALPSSLPFPPHLRRRRASIPPCPERAA